MKRVVGQAKLAALQLALSAYNIIPTPMAHEAEDVSPTSQVEESDPDVLSPPPDTNPEPGLNGKPVRCELVPIPCCSTP